MVLNHILIVYSSLMCMSDKSLGLKTPSLSGLAGVNPNARHRSRVGIGKELVYLQSRIRYQVVSPQKKPVRSRQKENPENRAEVRSQAVST